MKELRFLLKITTRRLNTTSYKELDGEESTSIGFFACDYIDARKKSHVFIEEFDDSMSLNWEIAFCSLKEVIENRPPIEIELNWKEVLF